MLLATDIGPCAVGQGSAKADALALYAAVKSDSRHQMRGAVDLEGRESIVEDLAGRVCACMRVLGACSSGGCWGGRAPHLHLV